jgi:hypothetical protein
VKRVQILLFSAICAASFILALCVGYVKSYLDEEVQINFFVKMRPSFKVEFQDPFANEGDDVAISELPEKSRRQFSDYCKYRFGIDGGDDESLETCKKKIPPYLR